MITNTAGLIITKGLGNAANYGLITTHFSLLGFDISVVIPPQPSPPIGGMIGGSVPIRPGHSAQVLQRPVVQNSTSGNAGYYVPYKPASPMQQVIIKGNWGGKDFEKNYMVPGFVPNVILKVSNVIDKTKETAKFIVNAKRISERFKVLLNKYTKIK